MRWRLGEFARDAIFASVIVPLVVGVAGCRGGSAPTTSQAVHAHTKFARVPKSCPTGGLEPALAKVAGPLYRPPAESGDYAHGDGSQRKQTPSEAGTEGGISCLLEFDDVNRRSKAPGGFSRVTVSIVYAVPSYDDVDFTAQTFHSVYARSGQPLVPQLGDESVIKRITGSAGSEKDCDPQWEVSFRSNNLIAQVHLDRQRYSRDPSFDRYPDGRAKRDPDLDCANPSNVQQVQQDAVMLAKAALADAENTPDILRK